MTNSGTTRARLFLAAAIIGSIAAGCVHTQSEVEVKPVDINLNISGRLEVVITDARKTEEQITGSTPKRVVTPADIGLPADGQPQSSAQPALENAAGRFVRVADDRRSQLIEQMRARHPQIQALLDGGLAGESHTGSLVPRAALSPDQQSSVDAENADRAELYKIESAQKNISVDKVALGYYLARLEHVNKGTWVEKFDQASGSWQWFQWNR